MTRSISIFFLLTAAGFALIPAGHLQGQTIIAREDFDGGDLNLTSGFNPDITTTPFTRYGVFRTGEFNSGNQAPFALVDDSVSDVSGAGAFPTDSEGIFGQNRNPDDNFFCVVSASDFNIDPADLTGTWSFNTASANGSELQLQIDLGQLSNDSFDGVPAENSILFEYRFNNAGSFLPAFTLLPTELVGTGFSYRLFDAGTESAIDFSGDGSHMGLAATNAGVTKILAENGAVANNLILDRTPADGPGAGVMDTFAVNLTGTGNSLEVRITVNFSFEAFAFDNIRIVTQDAAVLLGDVNLDGVVDLLDVAPFVDRVTSGTFQAEADINGDGVVNLLDVSPFVAILTGG